MKVGYLTASISRQAGGLSTSVRQEAIAVGQCGTCVEIFAARDSDSAKDLIAWQPLLVHLSESSGPARFSYAPQLGETLENAQVDVLASHGLWRYTSIVASRWHAQTHRPYIVSPHGMLDRWALRNSSFKKRIASLLFENRHLREATCIRALCAAEAEAIRETGLKNPVAVIPNGVEAPPPMAGQVAPPWAKVSGFGGTKVMLSLGRLHPKKNLIALLEAWRSVCDAAWPEAAEWRLVIAGLDEGGYENELKRCATELGLTESVWFAGPLYGATKQNAYRSAAAFIIPSVSEGLPMVVLEAWSYGLPVLMTAECNLPEGFAAGSALQITPNATSISEGIHVMSAMTGEQRADMGRRGKALTEQKFSWDRIGKEMASVLAWMNGQTSRPNLMFE